MRVDVVERERPHPIVEAEQVRFVQRPLLVPVIGQHALDHPQRGRAATRRAMHVRRLIRAEASPPAMKLSMGFGSGDWMLNGRWT